MDFFALIGAQRSGSTWLYQMLDEHPEIDMAKPYKPEPKHFINQDEFAKGRDYYLNKFFSPGKAIIGEKSTSYIEHPECCNKIKEFFPEAKIIAILRDPVTRALSNYEFSRKHKLEPRSREDVFLNNEPAPSDYTTSVNPFDYLARGKYINYLQPFIDCVGHERIKIITYEHLVNSRDVMDEIYNFVGCKNSYFPKSYKKIVNSTSGEYRSDEVVKALRCYYEPYNERLKEVVDTSWWM